MLPYGIKGWLNGESANRYPTVCAGNERPVIISGEAYFEVKEDKDRPFSVAVNGIKVEVLGTKFNVRAYDRMTRTTLAEGSVKIVNGHSKITGGPPAALLSPGQEAIATTSGIAVRPADLEKALAWKNGVFSFRPETWREIDRKSVV